MNQAFLHFLSFLIDKLNAIDEYTCDTDEDFIIDELPVKWNGDVVGTLCDHGGGWQFDPDPDYL